MQEAEQFAHIAAELSAESDQIETLSSICDFAVQTIDCSYAGIHVVRNREIETGAATDPLIERADKLQTMVGEGPCLDAIWQQDTFLVEDAAHDPRWQKFGPLAAELGLHSILSVRLFTDQETLGALNLYATDVREFSAHDIATAHVLAQHASIAFASARKESELRRARDMRHLIGQAQGILMERFDLSEDQAFRALRDFAGHSRRLTDVAEQLVTTRDAALLD